MQVLHICNGFTSSRLYDELFKRLSLKGFKQVVIAPTFDDSDLGITSDYYTIHRLRRDKSFFERIKFSKKIKNQISYIKKNIETQYDLIHAHTLFSDGSVAYELSIEKNIKFIVAIRNTDINFFFKYFIHLREKAYKILRKAEAIVLISPKYLERLKEILPKKLFDEIKPKLHIIPNGINNKWIEAKNFHYYCHDPFRLVYTGAIDRNKNIHSIIQAVIRLNRSGFPVYLSIIGKRDNQNDKYFLSIEKSINESRCKISISKRKDISELIVEYKSSDLFIMPSFHETFGLVYVEALSQGLPIIYTKREGFDGFFADGFIGKAVNANSINDIERAILYCANNYADLTSNISNSVDFDKFSWDKIADRYSKIYKQIINNND